METNPQKAQMADESMLRTLSAQMEAIWPQEAELLPRYCLRSTSRVLDLGCGPGELGVRLNSALPGITVDGVDLNEAHLARARHRITNGRLIHGDVLHPPVESAAYDVVFCRHVLQAVPHAEQVIAACIQAARPGGWVHLLAEDYGTIYAWPMRHDLDRFWRESAMAFGEATGTDMRIGRRAYTECKRAGLVDLRIDYATVDPVRVNRSVIARIWEAWRDGYVDGVAEKTGVSAAHLREVWDELIAVTRSNDGYVVWQVPIVTGRREP